MDTKLSDLSPARTLVALGERSELLVTGTRGHGGFTGMLLGSVTRKLAAHATCPLAVVRGEQLGDGLGEVVPGVGEKPGQSRPAMAYAFAAARRYGASLHAVRAWLPPTTQSRPMGFHTADVTGIRDEELQALDQLLAPMRESFPDVNVEISAGRGNPVPILVLSLILWRGDGAASSSSAILICRATFRSLTSSGPTWPAWRWTGSSRGGT